MAGIAQRIYGFGSDLCANCATTAAQKYSKFFSNCLNRYLHSLPRSAFTDSRELLICQALIQVCSKKIW